jgi:hypothetical protein
MSSSSKGGGVAMTGGHRFQARVTAWWCARIVLRTQVGRMFDLAATSVAERIYCETSDSVDDLRVELTGGAKVYGQCKRSQFLSDDPESKWGSVIKQFYKEFERPPATGVERRFVLFYEENNENLVKLRAILDRYRSLPRGTPLTDAASNKEDQEIVSNLEKLLDKLQGKPEFSALATNRQEFLKHIHIKQLQLGPSGADHLRVVDALGEGLLQDPGQVNLALTSYRELADDLMAERGTADRTSLRDRLKGEGIVLREGIDYRSDFELLDNLSSDELGAHESQGRTRLVLGSNQVPIDRPVVSAMLQAIEKTNFFVAGEAGTGKTGCLATVARKLRDAGELVWYWSADSLPHVSTLEIGKQIGLRHSWTGIFAEAASGAGSTLIIDGLDGLRDSQAQRAYRNLIALAIEKGIRIVASIRLFDLEYSVELQELMPSRGVRVAPDFTHPALSQTRHILVEKLSMDEFLQVVRVLPSVGNTILNSPSLLEVVLNLFSLDLLCKLLDGGEEVKDFSSVSTQAELFERYWMKRILAHELRVEMTAALEGLIRRMVELRSLQAVPPDKWSGEVERVLFSAGLVRHPPALKDRLPEEQLVEFNHHLLFDYAAERLFIRSKRGRLASELASIETWGLFLRPSLVLFHRYAWAHARAEFWDILISLERAPAPILNRLPGYTVVAQEARSREDLQPLIDGVLGGPAGDGGDVEGARTNWFRALQGVVATACLLSVEASLPRDEGSWWLEFAGDLAELEDVRVIHPSYSILLASVNRLAKASVASRSLFNRAAVRLLRRLMKGDINPTPADGVVMEWVCASIESDPAATAAAIRDSIKVEELKRAGFVKARGIASHIEKIWKADPALAVEIYDAIFGFVEEDSSKTSYTNSQIMSLQGNRKQDYEMSYYLLADKYPASLESNPESATRAMMHVVRHYAAQKNALRDVPAPITFYWDGCECKLQADFSHRWDGPQSHPRNQTKILHAWQEYLIKISAEADAEATWKVIKDLLIAENTAAAVWRRLMIAGKRKPEFYAGKLWTILLDPEFLTAEDTDEVAEDCIEAFAPHLKDEDLNRIVTVVLNLSGEEKPGVPPELSAELLQRRKARLFGCIPEERRNEETKNFLAGCPLEMLLPRAPKSQLSFYPSPLASPIDWEAIEAMEAGVEEVSPRFLSLREASNFLLSISSKDITDASLEEDWRKIQDVERLVEEARGELSEQQISLLEQRIVRGYSKIASSEATLDEQTQEKLFRKFRDVLTSSAEAPSQESLQAFDRDHVRSDPFNPRVQAATAFSKLAIKATHLSPEWKALLRQISNDTDPVVQSCLGEYIWNLITLWPEFVLETVEKWVSELPGRAGTVGLLHRTLRDLWFRWLRGIDRERAASVLKKLLEGARTLNYHKFRSDCGEWLGGLYLYEGEAWAGEILQSSVDQLRENLAEVWGAYDCALIMLFPRKYDEDEKDLPPTTDEQRRRAVGFVVRVLDAARKTLEAYMAEVRELDVAARPQENPDWVGQAARLFEQAGLRIHFWAQHQAREWPGEDRTRRDAMVAAFWDVTEPIFEALVAMPYPGIVFHLIEALEPLAPYDATRVIHWMRQATLASAPYGLAAESFAADRAVKILRQILADHTVSLASQEQVREDFIKTLEAYVDAGWADAIQLAVQLERIYR